MIDINRHTKNKVLLIYPGKLGGIYPEIPLSLLYLSSYLKKNNYDVEIFNSRLKNFKEIENKNYLFVGITSLTGEMIEYGLEIACHIKSLNKNTPIVMGEGCSCIYVTSAVYKASLC